MTSSPQRCFENAAALLTRIPAGNNVPEKAGLPVIWLPAPVTEITDQDLKGI